MRTPIVYKNTKATERCDMCGTGYATSEKMFCGGVAHICHRCVCNCFRMYVETLCEQTLRGKENLLG